MVIAKAAMSLDGKINTRTGDSKWISSEVSRRFVHELRSRQDAILVGINTVLIDNPRLTSHGRGKNPVRVIIDTSLKVPLTANLLNNDAPTVIFTNSKLKVKLDVLRKCGVIINNHSNNRQIDFKYIINELRKMSIYSVLIEGGGETIASAINAGVVDEVYFFLSPRIIGGRCALTPVEGQGAAYVAKAKRVKGMKITKIGPDYLITGKVS